ncbi:MAG TPA: arylesterase [Vicinamibacterales bacterium]
MLLVLAFACGGPPPQPASTSSKADRQPQPAASPDEPRIVVLGDSLTAGYGLASQDLAFPGVLQQRLDRAGYHFQVINAGVSGDTTAGGLRRLAWSLRGPVKILIVALGGNDGLRGIPVAEMKTNLATIIETAQGRGIDVLLAGMEAPPNYGPAYTRAFHQVFRDLAVQDHVTFVPFLLARVAGIASLNQADGIHPTPEGAQIVADNVWGALQPMLAGARRSESRQ